MALHDGLTRDLSDAEVLHDLGRQGVELDLLASSFHQSVIDFGHPLGEREFRPLIEEVSTVEFTVQLIDEVGACQAELVEEFTQSSACDMESVVTAGHQVLVQRFGGGGRRGFIHQFPSHRGVEGRCDLEGRECFAQVALGDPRQGFHRTVFERQGFNLRNMHHL